MSAGKQILLASYEVAYRIAKAQKPHTIGEDLIKPCTLSHGEDYSWEGGREELMEISLSNDVHTEPDL